MYWPGEVELGRLSRSTQLLQVSSLSNQQTKPKKEYYKSKKCRDSVLSKNRIIHPKRSQQSDTHTQVLATQSFIHSLFPKTEKTLSGPEPSSPQASWSLQPLGMTQGQKPLLLH